jgi:hypothetical protein
VSLIPGRTYHRRYGYPWPIAITAEFWWRVEHLPLGPVARLAYGKRKAAERRGTPLLP